MKKFLMMLISTLLVLSVVGCGSSSSDSDDNKTKVAQEVDAGAAADGGEAADVSDSVKKTQINYISEAKFSNGKYGAIVLSSNNNDVNDSLKGAHLIDVRTKWERDNLGYPEGFKESAVYLKRHYYYDNNGKKHHDGLNTDGSVDGTPNENFLSDIATIVGDDKNIKIVLVCDSGSRTGAYYDGEDSDMPSKDSAAKKLSVEGYTNVYHVYGGYKKWKENQLPVINK